MPLIAACPDSAKLAQLLDGTATADEIESFAQHLETCSTCAQRLEQPDASSQILDAVRKPAQPSRLAVDGRMLELMDRIDKLASPKVDPHQTAATPAPNSREVHTSVEGIAANLANTEHDYAALLEPPQEVGELGRLGAYRILRILGAGGMGVVYAAEDTTLKRPVALKAMRPSLASNKSARQRFVREAQAAAAVRNDHVVTIYQAGEQGSIAFLAMEYLEGESLEDRLKRDVPLPISEVIRIGREIAEGLAAAHAHGLIHRDIKPGNLWLEKNGCRVKLLDFGLARAVQVEGQLTQSGAIVGTPAYMSPEQANGDPVDFRSDLFSLGCVLYRMCTGVAPFQGKQPLQILRSVVEDHPAAPHEINSAVPAELSALVMRLLEKDASKRPESARRIAVELAAINPMPVSAAPPVSLQPKPRSNGWLSWAIAACLLLFAGGGGYLLYQVVIIRNPDGSEAARIKLQPGQKVEVVEEKGNGKDIGSKKPDPAQPLVAASGEPLSPVALVTKPAKILGVKSWTIESIAPTSASWNVAFRSDGRRMAAWNGSWSDATIRIWDTHTGALANALVGCRNGPYRGWNSLAWSKDGKRLASTDWYGRVYCWDTESNRLLWASEAPAHGHCVAWSPTGKFVAAGGSSGKVKVFETEKGQVTNAFNVEDGAVFTIAWSPDGDVLATSGNGRRVQIWSLSKGSLLESITLAAAPGENAGVNLEWSPDGKSLAIRETSARVRICEAIGSGSMHTKVINPTARFVGGKPFFDWSKDGKTLNGTLAEQGYWDVANGKITRPLQPAALLMTNPTLESGWPQAWAPGGKVWLAEGTKGGLKLWSTETGKPICEFKINPSLSWDTSGDTDALAPDSKRRAVASSDDIVRVIDPATGAIVKSLAIPGPIRFNSVVWSPNARRLLILRRFGSRIYDLNNDRLYKTGGGEFGAWSHDSKFVACGGEGGVTICDGATGQEVAQYIEKGLVGTIAFSPTQNLLAIGHKKGFRVYDVDSKIVIKAADWPEEHSCQLAWSPDGKRIVAGFGSYVVWEKDSGKILTRLESKFGGSHAGGPLLWSPDGKTISANGPGDNIYHWDSGTGKLLRQEHGEWPPRSKQPQLRYVPLVNEQFIAISPEGHYRGTPNADRHIVYVVETARGQETLTPAEMEKKYGWKNDPEKVRLTP